MENMPNDTLISTKPIWKDLLEILLTATIIYCFINIFFMTSSVNQTSMYPTFKDGDFIVATRGYLSGNEYDKGDVILFRNEDGRVLIKRVIGQPGDSLMIKDGFVYINNAPLEEKYLQDGVRTYPDVELKLDSESYFVMGDNRNGSLDSRSFGPINVSQIMGEVRIRIFPNMKLF